MAILSDFAEEYLRRSERTRKRRLKWWTDARFGMFIHWGLYSQLARHEWVMNRERIPIKDYEPLADTWHPRRGTPRDWASLAKRAGMKYMVLTAKHCEGFCLWDTQQHDYNAVQRGPGRDLVAEYVEACREFGLRVGLYYSLADWHHPDGHRCLKDQAARRRFTRFTHGCIRELMSNYGKIDILWYDAAWPLKSAAAWDSYRLNAMVRELQPEVLINNRALIPEDFATPEEQIRVEDRPWEVCATFNGSWGWQPAPPGDWLSVRRVLEHLRTCTAAGGNLLLNIGPPPDGSVPREATDRLLAVGRWLATHGGVLYGAPDRVTEMDWGNVGNWTRRANTFYLWVFRWPGKELAIGGLTAKLDRARLYPDGGPLSFHQTANRLVIHGLPEACPDKTAGVALVELKFKSRPKQTLGLGCV